MKTDMKYYIKKYKEMLSTDIFSFGISSAVLFIFFQSTRFVILT